MTLRGGGGGGGGGDGGCRGLSESVKKGKFVTKFFFTEMMNEVLIICERLCLLM